MTQITFQRMLYPDFKLRYAILAAKCLLLLLVWRLVLLRVLLLVLPHLLLIHLLMPHLLLPHLLQLCFVFIYLKKKTYLHSHQSTK